MGEVEEDGVGEAEDGGVRPDAKADGDDRDQGEQATTDQKSKCVLQILQHSPLRPSDVRRRVQSRAEVIMHLTYRFHDATVDDDVPRTDLIFRDAG
jgi:hypothetical protein